MCRGWARDISSSSSSSSSTAAKTKATHQQPQGHYTPITKKLWQERIAAHAVEEQQSPAALTSKAPIPTNVTYSFAEESPFKELYRNPWNKIRIGCILEDLDSLAGNIAFQHCCKPGSPPPLLVTAAVDEIDLSRPIDIENDVFVSGQVVWTGTSSLDIRITLNQSGNADPSLVALFSFVHLDPVTKRPAPVVQLAPDTDKGKALAKRRQAVADVRRAERQAVAASGMNMRVSPEALKWQAAALREARALAELPSLAAHDAVSVSASMLENTFITQPQQQNMHGRIFGGFLMRRAYELAFATTYAFAGVRPVFVKVDEVAFKRPVDVGDLLRFKSKVMHTARVSESQSLLFLDITASVAKPEALDITATNVFSFVFSVGVGKVMRVLPGSEEEARRAYECYRVVEDVRALLPATRRAAQPGAGESDAAQ